jgi:predicted DNA-binding transcriptional regulator AlpA
MSFGFKSPSESASPTSPHLHPMLSAFDELPDSAFVPLIVVCALFGCSSATVWRRVRAGQLVPPHRIGLRTTRWRVGDLRNELTNALGGV